MNVHPSTQFNMQLSLIQYTVGGPSSVSPSAKGSLALTPEWDYESASRKVGNAKSTDLIITEKEADELVQCVFDCFFNLVCECRVLESLKLIKFNFKKWCKILNFIQSHTWPLISAQIWHLFATRLLLFVSLDIRSCDLIKSLHSPYLVYALRSTRRLAFPWSTCTQTERQGSWRGWPPCPLMTPPQLRLPSTGLMVTHNF